ncbi:hypothetical protein [Phenylobacterium sp. 58.2.17]|uniref:hypothetical protein n=1 Tax=Phenylobacterium sp. 58.2.17 TaxID=2969306 RepID=UPI0022653418|nr:hypothetical protein [Phenylobacterium sp. 58.2.17]MCX7588796.1 hypothetical protein [Phenylobacterium sp. 58.2.17]
MPSSPYTVDELERIVERIDPSRLLFVRPETELDDEARTALALLLVKSVEPRQRLANVEYLLLLMHQARAVDSAGYLQRVFLPWVALRRRSEAHRKRIAEEFSRLSGFEAYSDADAAHIAIHIYRPLVSDQLDPYLTLLVASYEFIAGSFVDIETTNVAMGERNKIEFLEARIRQGGGPANLLSGYEPVVRNAVSHAGSDGLVFEPGHVIFRDIKRQVPPVIQTRRWSHDELHWRVLRLLEFLLSVDAATNVFGFDCLELLRGDYQTSALMDAIALTSKQRRELRSRADDALDRIRTADDRPIEERVDILGKILFRECALREIPCQGVSFNWDHKVALVQVPAGPPLGDDDDVLARISALVRYAVLAEGVFGSMFGRFVVREMNGASQGLLVDLTHQSLQDYADERAGLIDLICEAKIFDRATPIELSIDEAALVAAEDARLGPAFPRRGRPGVN